MTQKPYLNLGCGHIILPREKPGHYGLLPDSLTAYPLWHNVDRNAAQGVDRVMDLFTYPWALEDNAYDGALLSHIVEHIPHEPRNGLQDGWFAFFAELYRVLTLGALVHILCPYGWSQGAITDPTHTRLITEHTFTHSMQVDDNSPFAYATGGINFALRGYSFGLYPMFAHLRPSADDNENSEQHKRGLFQDALMTRVNVVNDLYAVLEVCK